MKAISNLIQKKTGPVAIIFGLIIFCQSYSFAQNETRPNEEGPITGLYVNTYTGNLFYERHDLVIPGKKLLLNFSFYYNSGRSSRDLGYGNGWSSSFSMHYLRRGEDIIIEHNDGQEDEYIRDGTNFKPTAGIHNSLTEYQDGKYLLMSRHGIKFFFDEAEHGKITKIEDRNGNTIIFSYSEGKLIMITDSSNRVYNLEWEDDHLVGIIDNNTSLPRIMSFAYDSSGNMTSYTGPMGNSTIYEYNDEDKLAAITDPGGYSTILEYNSNKALSLISHPASSYLMEVSYNTEDISTEFTRLKEGANLITTYTFDEWGRVTKTVFDNGTFILYEWDEHNNIKRYTDQNGNSLEQIFDESGNIIVQRDKMGYEIAYSYDPVYNLVISRTDRLGNTVTFDYDMNGNLIKATDPQGHSDEYTYDQSGLRTSRTDRNGNTFVYTYNNRGYLMQRTDPGGNSSSFGYDEAGNIISETDKLGNVNTYSYDPLNRLISIYYPNDSHKSYTYDAMGNILTETDQNGNLTTYTYGPLNRLVQIRDELDNIQTYSYDEFGNRILATDKNGNTCSYEFDKRNRLSKLTDPGGNITLYSYDPVGNRISETDPNGHTTHYSYDPANRLTGITDANGNIRTFDYDAEGNLIAKTDEKGNNTYLIYDNLNRLTKTIDPLGHVNLFYYDAVGNITYRSDPNEIVYSYSYDPLNRLISKSLMSGLSRIYEYDPAGNITSETDENGNITSYSYDNLNRLISLTDPLGFVKSYSYDPAGNLITETDPGGEITAYSYDPLNRLIKRTSAAGNQETYSYDPMGNMVSMTDGNGMTTNFDYDSSGRIISETSPSGHSKSYEYDGTGNLVKRKDRNGISTEYSYDPLNRLIEIRYPAGSVERTYDAAGNLVEAANTGIGLGDRVMKEYDQTNRLISETLSYGAFSRTVSYQYDPGGRITGITYPDGIAITRSFNNNNDLIAINDPLTGLVNLESNEKGNNINTSFPNGEYNESEYDPADRLLKRSTFNPDGTLLFEHEYSYDAMGRVVQKNKNGVPVANFTYDSSGRLLTAHYPWQNKNITYSYDNAGNRITESDNGNITSYTYTSGNRVAAQTFPDQSVINYLYDNNGNVIQTSSGWGVVEYRYDNENRLTRIEYPEGYGYLANYYSPEGKRIARDRDGNIKYFFPTILGNIIEMDEDGNTITRFNPGINHTNISSSPLKSSSDQIIYSHWGDDYSTTEFTSDGIVSSFEFDYFGGLLSSTGDVESVDPALYSSGLKADWDPLLGAELIGWDYAPDIDQTYGNRDVIPVEFIETGPAVDLAGYNTYRNHRDYFSLSEDGFGPGSDPFEEHVYNTVINPYCPQDLFILGPQMIDDTPGVNGSDGSDSDSNSGELCGYKWNDWIMTGTKWEYHSSGLDKSFLPQRRLIYKFELKKQEEEWSNVCLLEKGHTGHHRKSQKSKTGKTRSSSYSPPIYKYVTGPQIVNPNPTPPGRERDRQGEDMENDPNWQKKFDQEFLEKKIKDLLKNK